MAQEQSSYAEHPGRLPHGQSGRRPKRPVNQRCWLTDKAGQVRYARQANRQFWRAGRYPTIEARPFIS